METSLMLAMRPNEWKGLSPSRNTGFGVRSCGLRGHVGFGVRSCNNTSAVLD